MTEPTWTTKMTRSEICRLRALQRGKDVSTWFWVFVDRSGGSGSCWPWIGGLSDKGYGRVMIAGVRRGSHCVAYELVEGPIPHGLQIDHLCRNPACVNPSHLEAVTQGVNVLRGVSPSAQNARKTHCPRGHPLAGWNVIVRPLHGRTCRKCHNAACAKRMVRVRRERKEAQSCAM